MRITPFLSLFIVTVITVNVVLMWRRFPGWAYEDLTEAKFKSMGALATALGILAIFGALFLWAIPNRIDEAQWDRLQHQSLALCQQGR